jgi:methenyltetrahydrofolate cyclohydrolase
VRPARGDRLDGGSWAERPGRELLEAVAAHRSPLGGGSVAAITAALAAALVERCAAVAPGSGECRERAAALREELLAIADDDAAVLAGLIGGAGVTASASDPPRRLHAAAMEVAELARRLERDGVPRLRGEAACAAVLADAAIRAATAVVALNEGRGDGERDGS